MVCCLGVWCRPPAAIAAQLRKTAPEAVQLLGQDTVAALEAESAQQDPKQVRSWSVCAHSRTPTMCSRLEDHEGPSVGRPKRCCLRPA